MAISSLPSAGASISLQRTITTSGWVDLGDPRLIHFILAGGGGGGGGGANDFGGGGGGAGGAVAGKLFIGGRIYVQIGAGGTAGVIGSTAQNVRAGNGGNSYLGVPHSVSNDATATGMGWISAGGGIGGACGTSGAYADAAACKISLDSTGRPSLTGYTSPNTVMLGSAAGAGGGGGNSGGNGSTSTSVANYIPNSTQSSPAAAMLQGWANNDMRYFIGTAGTGVDFDGVGGMFGLNWTDFPGNLQSPTSSTYSQPRTLWTTGAATLEAKSKGGSGGSNANQPIGLNGSGAMFTGSGGGGAINGQLSGSGGGSSLNRGGESSRQAGNAVNRGGGGGAGILKPGSDGGVGTQDSVGGAGGDGGFGGGGGGGGQGSTTGGLGGVGGQGALALFW